MQYKISKPVRLIELFGGIGTQAMALRDLGVNFEHWRLSEWEVNSVKSYRQIHMPNIEKDFSERYEKEKLVDILLDIGISNDGKEPMERKSIERKGEKWLRETFNNFMITKNIGSIVNRSGKDLKVVDTDKYEYIVTWSFPCQDLSLSGLQKGMSEGEGTRSGLCWEVIRILSECKELGEMPQILLMENVSQIHSKKNIKDFERLLNKLEDLGYVNFYQDLNGKNYGVAQNRDRTFMFSILKSEIGDNTYIFPEPIKLEKRLKDYLEDKVDEKYYINTEKAEQLIGTLIDKGVLPRERNTYSLKNMGSSDESRMPDGEPSDVAHTVLARDYKGLSNYGSNGVIEKDKRAIGIDLASRNPDERDIANCIKTVQRGIVNFAQAETGVVEERYAE